MTFPKIQHAFNGWETDITLITVSQSIDSRGILVNVETANNFKGTIQPLTAEQIAVKPEGKRSWGSWQLHTRIDLGLSTGDKVKYLGKDYEVEALLDYSLNNYYEYHLLKDYE